MDTLIKIGGSLLRNPLSLKNLLFTFNELSKKHAIILLPGGGAFADKVREYYLSYKLSDSTAHKMAIMTEDIVGLLIKEYIEEGELIDNLAGTSDIINRAKIPILLPSKIILELDELPHSWDVTSDSIAVYLASKLKLSTVILVKDVDGLFTTDPKKNPKAQLIPSIKAVELNNFRNSCLDKAFSKFIIKYNVTCYLINGNFPERLEHILEGKKTVCSKITP